MDGWVEWLYQITKWYSFTWIISGTISYFCRAHNRDNIVANACRKFIGYTKPFYFVFIGGYYVSLSLMDRFRWFTPLLFLWDVYLYYLVKDEGDDSWKRRMEKLLEKIEVAEGKLVVVPS